MNQPTSHSTAESLIRRLNAMGQPHEPSGARLPVMDLQKEILARAHNMAPTAFERLVLDLLAAMGYGPHARRLGQSGDGGVDGLLARDPLFLEAVYFQAKRYRLEDTAAVSHIRDFAGSLDAHRAVMGIFATTAQLSKASHEFARLFSRKIVLIDGCMLAALLLQNKIGVRVREVLEVCEVDEDYFSGKRIADTISASIQPLK